MEGGHSTGQKWTFSTTRMCKLNPRQTVCSRSQEILNFFGVPQCVQSVMPFVPSKHLHLVEERTLLTYTDSDDDDDFETFRLRAHAGEKGASAGVTDMMSITYGRKGEIKTSNDGSVGRWQQGYG